MNQKQPDSAASQNLEEAARQHGHTPIAGDSVTQPLGAAFQNDPPDAATVDPLIGRMLAQYHVLELLGTGGMGAVYKARHVRLKKLVAIKVIRRHLADSSELIGRFEREMEAAGSVEHPHLVRALDAGTAGDLHFLVMEYVPGTDLGKLVRAQGPVAPPAALKMIRDAALGLEHAHALGMIHRDIKPTNLLLTPEGQVKVLDLGLARLQQGDGSAEALTQSGQVIGTPDYMAPEQWHAVHAVDARADLYALGGTLCYLLTGQAPFQTAGSKSAAQLMHAHIMQQPPGLKLLRPDLPESVEELFWWLMAKDPKDRPENAAELIRAIDQMLPDVEAVCLPSGDGQAAQPLFPPAGGTPRPSQIKPGLRTPWVQPQGLTGPAMVNPGQMPASGQSPHMNAATPTGSWYTRRLTLLCAVACVVLVCVIWAFNGGRKPANDGDDSAGGRLDRTVPTETEDERNSRQAVEMIRAVNGWYVILSAQGESQSGDQESPFPSGNFRLQKFGPRLANTFEDGFLTNMPAIPTLEIADLSQQPISRAGLRQLRKFPKLESLWLNGTQVDDNACQELLPLPIKFLALHDTAVTELGVATLLAGNSTLHSLALDGKQCTPSIRKQMDADHPIYDLRLVGPQVTDETLLLLQGQPTIASLTLDSTHVTEVGLLTVCKVESMPNLLSLRVTNGGLTNGFEPRMQQANPALRIYMDAGLEDAGAPEDTAPSNHAGGLDPTWPELPIDRWLSIFPGQLPNALELPADGGWRLEDGALKSNEAFATARLVAPQMRLPPAYAVRVRVRLEFGSDAFYMVLPVANTHCFFGVNTYPLKEQNGLAAWDGFGFVDGQPLNLGAASHEIPFHAGLTAEIVAVVQIVADQVTLQGRLNGQRVTHWAGHTGRLSIPKDIWNTADGRLGLGSVASSYVVEAWDWQPIEHLVEQP